MRDAVFVISDQDYETQFEAATEDFICAHFFASWQEKICMGMIKAISPQFPTLFFLNVSN